jgi:methyl-accepting chemotaxis protein
MPVTRQVHRGFWAIIWLTLVLSVLTFYAIAGLTSVLHRINTYDVSSMQLSGEISKKIYQTTSNVYQTIAGTGKIERPDDQLNEVMMLLGSMRQLLGACSDAKAREVLRMLDDIEESAGEYTEILVRMQHEEDPDQLYLLLRALSGKGEWLISRSEHVQLRIWEQIGPRLARTERFAAMLEIAVAAAFVFAFAFGALLSRSISRTLTEASMQIRCAAETTRMESENSVRVSVDMHSSAEQTHEALESVLGAFRGVLATSQVSTEASLKITEQMETGAAAARTLADRTLVTARAASETQSTLSALGMRLTFVSTALHNTVAMVRSNLRVAVQAGERAEKLHEQMDRIDAALQSITKIADQTELIALDARIASARADENGLEFGRVASEIGGLAKMTAGASLEVRRLMDGIKASTVDVARSLENSMERIQSLLSQAAAVEDLFGEIQTSFSDIIALMEQVKDAANAGAGEADLVQTSMSEILDSARMVAAQAGELEDKMREVVERATAAVAASEILGRGIASQAESAKEQSRLAGQVTLELARLSS